LFKIGVKLTPFKIDKVYIGQISDYADYIELYIDLKKTNADQLNFDIPVATVHITQFCGGVNFADSSREKINLVALEKALNIANSFKSEKVIFHPELIQHDLCSIEHLIEFLIRNHDCRMKIENMPLSSNGIRHLGANYAEIKEMVLQTKIGFCLDYAHACEYTTAMRLNPENVIKELLLLNPTHFHLVDTDLGKVFDINYNENHLNLGKGNIDIEMIKKNIPNGSEVTIETPQDLEYQIEEIRYLKY